jgi:hypothetical protein
MALSSSIRLRRTISVSDSTMASDLDFTPRMRRASSSNFTGRSSVVRIAFYLIHMQPMVKPLPYPTGGLVVSSEQLAKRRDRQHEGRRPWR